MGIQEFQSDKKYDIIVCNSPYFKTSPVSNAKVKSMKTNRRIARHLHSLTIPETICGLYCLLILRFVFDNCK